MNADKCPHCGSPRTSPLSAYWTCKADTTQRDEDGRTHLCREREAHNKTKWENVKLRELLHCAADDLQHWDETVRAKAQRELYDFLEKGAALAPAPEEPANPTCSNTTHKFSHCDCKEPVSLDPAPKIPHEGNCDEMIKQHEWRELGPYEEIHTGDQVQARHHDRVHGVWYDAFPYEVGAMPIDHEAMRYRTRRPLPKPALTRESYDEDWNLKPKQERNPPRLDAEIEVIDTPSTYSVTEARHATADAIQYLRDEIQKLKEAR